MKATRELKDGTVWVLVEMDNGLSAELCSVGAGSNKISLDGRRLTLTLKDRDFYRHSNQFFGKTLGRVAGRLPLEYRFYDKTLHLDATEKYDDLHSGKMNSLSFQDWDVKTEESADRIKVIFSKVSPDGDCHFPGELRAQVTYEFLNTATPEFFIRFSAESDTLTPVSFSNHIYWNLNDDNDVSGQTLYMNADRYGTDDGVSQLITGVGPIPESMDFRTPAKLGPRLDFIEENFPTKTIDHTYLYQEVRTDKPQASLEDSKIRVDLYTDMEAMNIYVDNSQTPVEFENGERLTSKRRAIALEPQQFLLNKENISVEPGKGWNHWIRYTLNRK